MFLEATKECIVSESIFYASIGDTQHTGLMRYARLIEALYHCVH